MACLQSWIFLVKILRTADTHMMNIQIFRLALSLHCSSEGCTWSKILNTNRLNTVYLQGDEVQVGTDYHNGGYSQNGRNLGDSPTARALRGNFSSQRSPLHLAKDFFLGFLFLLRVKRPHTNENLSGVPASK